MCNSAAGPHQLAVAPSGVRRQGATGRERPGPSPTRRSACPLPVLQELAGRAGRPVPASPPLPILSSRSWPVPQPYLPPHPRSPTPAPPGGVARAPARTVFARSEIRCIYNVIFLIERSSWHRSGCAPRQQHHPYARPSRSGSRQPARAVRRRLIRRDLRWACWLSASVIEASPRTQRPRVGLRHLEDDVPEVAEARPRATSTVLTGNKYRSHDEQVPFSRAISTVLAKEGGGGREGGRRGAVRKHSQEAQPGDMARRCGQGRLTAAMTALARPGTAESGRECW